ncbi:DsbA family protein [Streptomyces sp. RTd22]|uniref:DsbA family protein n=1 Tax=Streptomyces sp. RTd22 TaxID=1841249 RepID=UPI0007C4DDA6|nr:DsbA family protein [Streptomyces sp. RTd22]
MTWVRVDSGGQVRPEDTSSVLRITEFTDAACPWAWGSEPAFRLLRQTLGRRADWRRVSGILFDEDDDPAPDPDAEARWYQRFIDDVTLHTGAPYAPRLQWLTRSSWPASLAAKAAEAQGPDVAQRVVRRLRETTFVLGTPADTEDGIRDAVCGVPGLDVGRLLRDLGSPRVRDAVREDWAETRRPIPEVVDLDAPGPHGGRAKEVGERRRYALPTLLLDGPGGGVCVPGWRPFAVYLDAARAAAGDVVAPAPVKLSAGEALERWRSLTGPELTLLAEASGDPSNPPADAVRIETGNGPLWLHPGEARYHPAVRRVAD